MKTDPNEPINPHPSGNTWEGLTKREYFASLAMQGMLQAGAMTKAGFITRAPDSIAQLAVNQADSLIAALNEEVPNG